QIHDVRRAAEVGSIDEVIAPAQIRPAVAKIIGARKSEADREVSKLTLADVLAGAAQLNS
ncbi:MAG TPA: hypothetical protein P5108_11695, partial [Marmoricola sp.]|nr:hypothetical protein [Marmoricola sp.]